MADDLPVVHRLRTLAQSKPSTAGRTNSKQLADLSTIVAIQLGAETPIPFWSQRDPLFLLAPRLAQSLTVGCLVSDFFIRRMNRCHGRYFLDSEFSISFCDGRFSSLGFTLS